jgi:predicted Kef-type K+ transport protein
MPLLRSIPSKRIINGVEINTSENLLISESFYKTNGEYAIVIKGVDFCELLLDSKTSDHVVVKALTRVLIKPDKNKIDEEFEEVEINKGACVEFYFMGGSWYILSSDGLKLS